LAFFFSNFLTYFPYALVVAFSALIEEKQTKKLAKKEAKSEKKEAKAEKANAKYKAKAEKKHLVKAQLPPYKSNSSIPLKILNFNKKIYRNGSIL